MGLGLQTKNDRNVALLINDAKQLCVMSGEKGTGEKKKKDKRTRQKKSATNTLAGS